MRLLIDAGNTRIKWRAVDAARGWHHEDPGGVLALDQAATLTQAWQALHVRSAWIACVADEQIFAGLCATLADTGKKLAIHRVQATAHRAGLVNGYLDPGQLGVDRWVGAIGARTLCSDRLLVIATLGTATTIDVVVPLPSQPETQRAAIPQARFHGGVILPGIEMMRRALRHGTARLPLATGTFRTLADNTDDAIISGILHAQAGAIERVCKAAGAETGFTGEPLCLLGGGAAAQVAPLLTAPAFTTDLRIEHNLVLRGLARIADTAQ